MTAVAGRVRYRSSMRAAILALLLVAGMTTGMPLPEKVPVPGGDTYRLRFGTELSLNDRCPVRKAALNPRMRPVWVNGRPIGFC